jgi:Ca-activated chloride channel family protein
MNFKDACIAYLNDELSVEDKKVFEAQLESSADRRRELEQYKELLVLERALASMKRELGPDFTVKVMEALDEESLLSRFFGRYLEVSRKFVVPMAGVAVVLLCVLVARESADQSIDLAKQSTNITAVQQVPEKLGSSDADLREQEERVGEILETQVGHFSRQTIEGGTLAGSSKEQDEAESLAERPKVADQKDAPASYSEAQDMVARNVAPAEKKRDSSAPTNLTTGAAQPEKKIFRSMDLGNQQSKESVLEANSQRAAEAIVKGEALYRDRNRAVAPPPMYDQATEEDSAPSSADRLEMAPQSKSLPAIAGKPQQALQREQNVGQALTELEARSRRAPMPTPVSPVTPPAPVSSIAPGEGYAEYEETPRIPVVQQPVSTFSLDVDTGSYTNARRFLRAGQLPPQDSVRIEEFVNYFRYDYPQQYDAPFAVHSEIAPSPFSPGRHLLRLGVKARDIAADRETPWNLVFLVDVSGSMDTYNKLPLVQQSLNFLASQMRPQDRIAIVTYANGSNVILDSTPGSQKAEIMNRISQLRAGGGTNGSGGIQLAYDIAARNKIAGGVNRVVLATDGDFNVGISDFNGLMKLIEEKRAQGTMLTTLGFGVGNYQEKNLEQLANRGNGNYYYIDSFDEARKVLGQDLAGTMQVVAKDVKVQLELNPAQVVEYRLIGYDNRRLRNQDFNDDSIDAGEIGAGHTVTVFYEITLADSAIAKNIQPELRYGAKRAAPEIDPALGNEIGFVKIRFKQPEEAVSNLREFAVGRDKVGASFASASKDFRFAAAVSGMAQLLRGGQFAREFSFETVRSILADAELTGADQQRQEFKSLFDNAASLRQIQQ